MPLSIRPNFSGHLTPIKLLPYPIQHCHPRLLLLWQNARCYMQAGILMQLLNYQSIQLVILLQTQIYSVSKNREGSAWELVYW